MIVPLTKIGVELGLLVTLEGDPQHFAQRLLLKTSNNEAEYKALIARLYLAKTLEAKQIYYFNDFQHVVKQVLGEFQSKD